MASVVFRLEPDLFSTDAFGSVRLQPDLSSLLVELYY